MASNPTTPRKRLPKAPQAVKSAALHPASPKIAHVPDKSIVKRYIGRTFDNGDTMIEDMAVYDYAFENGLNMLLEGPTGPGKTMCTKAWAASRDKLLARIPSYSGIEASQLFGKYNPDKVQGGFHWVDGPVTYVWRNGGVLLWNEINFTPERIGSVMFGALDDNREIVLLDHEGEAIRAHRGSDLGCWCELPDDECDDKRVLIVADMNPDYAGTRDLNAALRNRFAVQLVWDYDANVEAQLIKSANLREMAKQVREASTQAHYTTPVSTNMLEEFEKMAKGLSVQFAINNFISHFKPDEREPIKLVCEAKQAAITQDYRGKRKLKKEDAKGDFQPISDWVFGGGTA